MAVAFSTNQRIDNRNFLYGRDSDMSQLLALADRNSSVCIIGLRRFGKTSLLLTLEAELREKTNSKVYPIYVDFKEVGSIIKGTDNVYRYMIALFACRLCQDKIYTEKLRFKKVFISPSSDWVDIFEEIAEVNPVRIQGLFEEIVSFFAEYINKTILFLFDEYEFLFKYSFDNPVGFMKLRNFSAKLSETGLNHFSFFISGAVGWNHLCTVTGSPEMNCIDETRYLGPIVLQDFKLLWKDECDKIRDCPAEVANGWAFAYGASGGIPFFAKIIGGHWLTTKVKPNYFLLNSYFQEIISSLQAEEREIMLELGKHPKKFKESKFVRELTEKGLIVKQNSIFSITIGFLKDYINAVFHNTPITSPSVPKAYTLTDSISKLIITINNTSLAKKGYYIFEPVNDESALLIDLRTVCLSSDLYANFASSLYKMIFERTKQSVNGTDVYLKKLPHPYKKGNQFIDLVDIMRHSLGGGHLMGTFTLRPGQITKTQMLEILTGTKNEPSSSEEFQMLQEKTLEMFELELQKINTIVRSI